MGTHDRHQSTSGEAYMAFPKMLHSCLACLQWKNPDAGNYSTRQCAAIREHDTLPEKDGEPFFKSLSAFASDPRRRAVAPVNTYTALSSRWRGLAASDVLAPLLTPLTSGATLQ